MNWRCVLLSHRKRVDREDGSADQQSKFAFQVWRISCVRPGCAWSERVRETRTFIPIGSKKA